MTAPTRKQLTEQAAALREALGCTTVERTTDVVKRLIAERNALRLENEALKRAAREFWEHQGEADAAE